MVRLFLCTHDSPKMDLASTQYGMVNNNPQKRFQHHENGSQHFQNGFNTPKMGLNTSKMGPPKWVSTQKNGSQQAPR